MCPEWTIPYLVERPECRTNRPYYVNIINFWPNPYTAEPAAIARLYSEKGLSAKQIAAELGIAKSTVLKKLHQCNMIKKGGRRKCTPDHYRLSNPPYGYRIKNGKLEVNRTELRVCRLVVNLISDKKLSSCKAANELERRGIRNRKGLVKWGHFQIQSIFSRWKGKL